MPGLKLNYISKRGPILEKQQHSFVSTANN